MKAKSLQILSNLVDFSALSSGDKEKMEETAGKIESYIDELVSSKLESMRKIVVDVKFTDDEFGRMAKEISEREGLPHPKKKGDAGSDLYSILPVENHSEGLTIFPGERKMIQTGLCLQMPDWVWCEVVHRSSTEKKYRLRIVPGTIDQGYCGPLIVQASNDNSFPIMVHHGERYAQLRFFQLLTPTLRFNQSFRETERGEGGFGSTGKGLSNETAS